MNLKRGFLQILLAALLLLAQHAALTHGLRHGVPNLPAQTQQDDGGKQTTQSGLCDFHGAFAEVLGAVGSCAMPLLAFAQAGERVADPRHVAPTALLLAPLSRGPPVLV